MRQKELERRMKCSKKDQLDKTWAKGVERRDVSRDPAVGTLVKTYTEIVEREVEEFISVSTRGRPGRKSTVALDFEGWNSKVLAYVTCSSVFNSICLGDTAAKCALEIGQRLEDDERVRKFQEVNSKALRWAMREIKKRKITRPDHKRTFLLTVARHKGASIPKWPKERRVRMGMALINAFCKSTRLARLVPVRNGRKTYNRFEATPQIMMFVEGSREDRALFRPTMRPMVEPPRPWSTLDNGGYQTFMTTLVKLPEYSNAQTKLLEAADLSAVYSAVNTMDATPFRVNKQVLKVIEYFSSHDIEVGSLVSGQQRTVEPMPEDVAGSLKELTPEQREKRKSWRKYARSVHEKNASITANKLQAMRVIDLAVEFQDEETLYYPHQLDFRGRVYDMPTGLNPQGPDYARSLLEFAEAKPIETDDAMRWLQVHGANCFGKDKCSMAERIEWVKANYKEIRKCARDPLRNTWWHDADKPWSFLAWCFDYIGVYEHEQPSRVAVALDGSCNGLQHLSAMLRDPVGAEAVNLKPSPVPQDIYQRVADVVIADLRAEAPGKKKLWADAWLHSDVIDRSLCKRSVMVMPYGGTMTSTMKYVEKSARDALGDEQVTALFGDDQSQAMHYLAEIVHAATRKVVTKAAVAMQWLQDVADVAVKAGVHVSWITPHGFAAYQHYVRMQSKEVHMRIGTERLFMSLLKPTKNIDTQKSRNSISPNFVHSLDACAMMMTVAKAREHGVTHFRMVHDDYGTHAADTAVLARCLREAFVELYRDNDVLADFLYQVKQQLPMELHAKLPELPKPGFFDIEDVLHSEFFFA